jgi:hypothetical protein
MSLAFCHLGALASCAAGARRAINSRDIAVCELDLTLHKPR